MKTIVANNINEALSLGIQLILKEGKEMESRNGNTLEIDCPVTTVYRNPINRVLMSKVRDANPFFHLMESLWILAGRNDVKFLNEFNSQMVNYSDDGKTFNAAYGYRLKYHFGHGEYDGVDQLDSVINILKDDPNSRQAVCQIWCPGDQNDFETKDKACNMSIVFRIRNNKLNMTVYNRSNDMLWGAYGANVVQFSMIQEYVAAYLNIHMGTYTHVSNSFHVYTTGKGGKLWDKLCKAYEHDVNVYDKVETQVLMKPNQIHLFDYDLNLFFNYYDIGGLKNISDHYGLFKSAYFRDLVLPMLSTYCTYKLKDNTRNYETMISTNYIISDDWRLACQSWLENRL